MLQKLLRSYAAMRVPSGFRLHFVIVENNDSRTLAPIIEGFRKEVPQWRVQYALEPRLGIAFARNRVLDCALLGGHDLLTFADDDEVVESEWLAELLAERDALNLDIVGSPVRLAPPESGSSQWQRLIWSVIDRMINERHAKFVHLRSIGCTDQIPIATGSWMGDLRFFHCTGLRFDNELGLAGDEDGRLWRDAKRLGASTGWTPYAIAHETVPAERMSLLYQYKRSRDYSITKYAERFKRRNRNMTLGLPGSLVGRTLSLTFCLAAVPFTRGRSLVRAAQCAGRIAGVLQARAGKRSSHYENLTGS